MNTATGPVVTRVAGTSHWPARQARGNEGPANATGRVARQRGLTIVELMLALCLGLALVLASASMLVSGKAIYLSYTESVRMDEAGRLALEMLAHGVRQAGLADWRDMGMPADAGAIGAAVAGLDNRGQGSGHGMERHLPATVTGGDVLALRFSGSADGAMIDCAGFAVAAPRDPDADRGWSIFYLDTGIGGEPELRCKYRADSGDWRHEALVRGVESFQLLFGVDNDGDGLPDRYLKAATLDHADASAGLAGWNDPAGATPVRIAERNRRTIWKRVVSVRMAMLLRSTAPQRVRAGAAGVAHHLFGPAYAALRGGDDPGSTVDEALLPVGEQGRQRKEFTSTVMLRNPDLPDQAGVTVPP